MNGKALNTTNHQHITYEHPPLDIAVLGGIKLDGLDRMRATLKISIAAGDPSQSFPLERDRSGLCLRHSLDLYNNLQLDKLIRKTAERLEVGTSVIHEALVDLTDQLEQYRLDILEKRQASQSVERKMLTPDEIKSAKKYASTANLMQRTGDDLQAIGIIGEWENALTLFIVMTSRKCKDPLSAITLAKSGMGKSYLQEKVAATMPEEDIIESTMITESSFYRFGRNELSGKLFLIEDLDGAEAVLYPIREMQSKKRISKTMTLKDPDTGESKTVTLVVEGPVSVCGCSTRESIYEDNENRSLVLHLDGSKAQDDRIMDYHRKVKAGKIDKDKEAQTREQLEHVQRILLPVKIVNPYAELIVLPPTVRNPRRTLPLLLGFIEAITHYHQYQREEKADENGELYIETTPEDIEWAFKLLKGVLFRKSDELSGACRKFYDWLQQWTKENNIDKFYSSQIRKANPIYPRTLRRYLENLTDFGRIEVVGGNKHKTGYQYQLSGWQADKGIHDTITQWIDQTLGDIRKSKMPLKAVAAERKAKKPLKKSA